MKLKMPGIGSRIRKVRKDLGLSQGELAKKLDLKSKMAVSHYEKGDSDPEYESIEKISKLSGASVDWLLYGEITEKEVSPRSGGSIRYLHLPMRGDIAAGNVGFYEDEGDGEILVPKTKIFGSFSRDTVWLRVRGDSMEDKVFDGDFVFVKPFEANKITEKVIIGACIWRDGAALKKVQRMDSGYRLTSFNSDKHPEIRVKGDIRFYKMIGLLSLKDMIK